MDSRLAPAPITREIYEDCHPSLRACIPADQLVKLLDGVIDELNRRPEDPTLLSRVYTAEERARTAEMKLQQFAAATDPDEFALVEKTIAIMQRFNAGMRNNYRANRTY